jgi:hypothetical protein
MNGAEQCHCERGWFNPSMYGECARCRHELVAAINVIRQVLPGARIVGTPVLPYELVGGNT